MTLHEQLLRRGGVARTAELTSLGARRVDIQAAVRGGDVLRIRRGWYGLPTLSADVVRAVRVGGALSCVSAAREHGLWVPPQRSELHVAVATTAARLRVGDDRSGVVVHWVDPSSRTVQPLPEAIALAIRCCGDSTGFVLLESALHLRAMTRGECALLNALAPRRFRRLSSAASPLSESGTESLLKLRLMSLGLPFRQQVAVPGVGRVDFLVGDSLIIEVDSRAHHSEPYRDRKRDAILSAQGRRVLRFMYSQIVYEPDEVEAAIVGAVVRGDVAG